MRGGMVVVDEATAEALRELPESRGQDIKLDSRVQLEPCMPKQTLEAKESYWQKQGRPCPYVEADPRNADATTLLLTALPEHTRPLTPALAEALLADYTPSERAAVLHRVSIVLRSEPVMAKLYPSSDDPKDK